jgi:hypothetical protein
MLKAISFPPDRAEEALATMRQLVELATEQLEMCREASEELEFAGELRARFMKRMVQIQSEIRKARSTLKDLAKLPDTADPASKG